MSPRYDAPAHTASGLECALPRFQTLTASLFLLALLASLPVARATLPTADEFPRTHQTLTTGWRTFEVDTATPPGPEGAPRPDPSVDDPARFSAPSFDDSSWRTVEVPHNWDTYQGYQHTKHGELHGTAWYRRTFAVDATTLAAVARGEQRVFLLFEGVGSYAIVWVNGREVGRHAGGLTTFTLDISAALQPASSSGNVLAVRADHPAGIRDLPWVCGGCERAYGFSEGSQPFGVFRPVHVIVTNSLRIAPFGVHVWNDRSVTTASASASVQVDITNYAAAQRRFVLRSTLLSPEGQAIAQVASPPQSLAPGATVTLDPQSLTAAPARLWSLTDPALYVVRCELLDPDSPDGSRVVLDRVDTPYGFRWISWPQGKDRDRGTFLLNGQPVFLNGTCEYPHLLGGSHAFSAAQIAARVHQIEAAGFNAFRDAHHPHDLRYNQHWDHDGLAWWTQFGAHIWFDRDDFRTNYLALLRDWVKERRNSPSLVLWGLQNESQLPAAFAAECTALIRELDPTARDQRLVTTCNGGEGTDWNVPQNWTGTYGGDPLTYAADLRHQSLVGEYGAWRSADLHSPDGTPSPVGYDEETFTALLETKVRLAESVRDHVAGHFQWLFSTHENPGRTFGPKGEQLADGWSLLDRVGPANNKGLLTSWGEPLDAYYMYRSNFVSALTQPMVVIAGSNWPDRVTSRAGQRVSGIIVYSNCDDVELFNGPVALGRRTRAGVGTHFQWEGVQLQFRELRAIARRAGQVVARDTIELPHLPPFEERSDDLRVLQPGNNVGGVPSPRMPPKAECDSASAVVPDTTAPEPAFNYLYRVNCGGPAYIDSHGQRWSADRDFNSGDSWGCQSWAAAYPHLPAALGSVRRVFTPVTATADPALYQRFRYGRDQLRYVFSLPNGDYRVELHFAEPWYGRGNTDATGWRLFDVALNGRTVLHDLDLYHEAGFGRAVVKVADAHVANGRLEISFPRVASYEAVISAIAIATRDMRAHAPPAPPKIIASPAPVGTTLEAWLDSGDRAFANTAAEASELPRIALDREADRQASHRSSSDFEGRADRAEISGPRIDSTATIADVPEIIRHQSWLRRAKESVPTPLSVTLTAEADVYAAVPRATRAWPGWESTGETLTLAGVPTESLALLRCHHLAGDKVQIPAAELVVLVPTRPLAPPQAIRKLHVEHATLPSAWRPAGSLQRGDRPYGPNGPALTELPSDLTDSDWLVTPATERSSNLRMTFTAGDHVEVTVAMDARITPVPTWLRNWLPIPERISIGEREQTVYRRRYELGARIELGPNGALADGAPAPMYAVFSRAVRPSAVYPTSTPALTPAKPTVTWTIKVGVGDRYGFVIPYRKSTDGMSRVRYELLNENGAVLCTDQFDWMETDGAARLRTCTSINAGTYRVRLSLLAGPPLSLSTLTVE